MNCARSSELEPRRGSWSCRPGMRLFSHRVAMERHGLLRPSVRASVHVINPYERVGGSKHHIRIARSGNCAFPPYSRTSRTLAEVN